MKNAPMTRELAGELWPILKAWSEQKDIQCRIKGSFEGDSWHSWKRCLAFELPIDCSNLEFRIEPECELETCEQFNARMQPLKEAYWAMSEAYKKVFPNDP